MKEFLILIRENLEEYQSMSPEEMQQCIGKHVAWVEKITAEGHFKSANPLRTEGRVIKGSERMITDGPFIETKEVVSGYYLLYAASLDEATRIAGECPDLDMGATIEVREVLPEDEQCV